MSGRVCSIEGCEAKHLAKGFCREHYRQSRPSESIPYAERSHLRAGRAICAVDQCVEPWYAKKLCVRHYDRMRKNGTTGTAERLRREPGTGSVNEYGYMVLGGSEHPLATAQKKLLVHRGVLYDAIGPGAHPCRWCGKTLPWRGRSAAECINVDHLDFNKLNNRIENLVVSCLDCNTKRSEQHAA